MADITQFVSREERAAEENLAAFISLARDELTVFSDGGAWDDSTWSKGNLKIVFCKHRPRSDSKKVPIPLDEPFLSFAKAYVRYRYSHQPVSSVATWLSGLRMLEKALIRSTGRADISGLSVPVLDLSIRLCRESFEAGHLYQAGRQIEAVAGFCREHCLVSGLSVWRAPSKRPADRGELLTEEGEAHRAEKMPSNNAMLALAELFAAANDKESRYFSSIMVLMMVAPGRISEVFRLPVDCIGWDRDSQGANQMFLRWNASKGGGPMKKWVPASMQSVVLEAVERLSEIGAPARAAARFAYDNPGKFMRHSACITSGACDEEEELSSAEVGAAIGVKLNKKNAGGQLPPYWRKIGERAPFSYQLLADEVANLYKTENWPFVDEKEDVKVWDALCLVREFELHKSFTARPFSWRMTKTNEVNDRLGHREQSSLFERGGFKEDGGGGGSGLRPTSCAIG